MVSADLAPELVQDQLQVQISNITGLRPASGTELFSNRTGSRPASGTELFSNRTGSRPASGSAHQFSSATKLENFLRKDYSLERRG